MKRFHKSLSWILSTVAVSLLSACADTPKSQADNQADVYQELPGRERAHLRIQMNDSSVILSRRPLGVKVQNTSDGLVIYSRAKKISYTIEGKRDNGGICIYSNHPFVLQLKDLYLSNQKGPAIDIRSSETAVIVASGESELSDGRVYSVTAEGSGLKACISSKGHLVFAGDGKLTVTGNYKHAVKSEGFIRVTQQCSLVIPFAVKDGLNAGTHLLVDGGELQVTAMDDGLKCPGNLVIAGGNTVIRAKGGEGSEGIEGHTVTVRGGSLRVLSADDAVNATADISIEGGLVYAYSTSNDAVDANGSIAVKGGTLLAFGGQVPEGGIDCDWNPVTVTGGMALCIGGDNSRPSQDASTQPVIEYGMENALEKDERLTLCDTAGNALFSFVSPRSYFKASVFYTSPLLKVNNSYSFYTQGTCLGGDTVFSVVSDAQLLNGSLEKSFLLESMVTTVGMVMGGPGGPMGGPGMPGGPMGGPGMPGGPMGGPDFPDNGMNGGPNSPMGGRDMPRDPMGGPGMPGGPMGGPGMPGGPMPFAEEDFPEDFPPSLPSEQRSSF